MLNEVQRVLKRDELEDHRAEVEPEVEVLFVMRGVLPGVTLLAAVLVLASTATEVFVFTACAVAGGVVKAIPVVVAVGTVVRVRPVGVTIWGAGDVVFSVMLAVATLLLLLLGEDCVVAAVDGDDNESVLAECRQCAALLYVSKVASLARSVIAALS